MGKKERDEDYEEWLRETDHKDTKLNRGWYDCPEEKRHEYIEKHKSWWEKF